MTQTLNEAGISADFSSSRQKDDNHLHDTDCAERYRDISTAQRRHKIAHKSQPVRGLTVKLQVQRSGTAASILL